MVARPRFTSFLVLVAITAIIMIGLLLSTFLLSSDDLPGFRDPTGSPLLLPAPERRNAPALSLGQATEGATTVVGGILQPGKTGTAPGRRP